jgi:hypothetical protein
MRKRAGRYPEVEALDSRTLLSGTAAAQPVAAFISLQLSGSLHGTTSTRPSPAPTFQVSGLVSPLGKVTAAGHGSIATVTGPNGSFSLLTELGRVFVSTDVVAAGKRSFSGSYKIQGGTESYVGDTGSGSFAVSYLGNRFFASFS